MAYKVGPEAQSHVQYVDPSITTTQTQQTKLYTADPDHTSNPYECFAIFCSYLFALICFPYTLCTSFKVVREYQRAVIFRMGRIREGGTKGPGSFFVLCCVDECYVLDMRTVTFDVPPQEVLTHDSVTVAVDAVRKLLMLTMVRLLEYLTKGIFTRIGGLTMRRVSLVYYRVFDAIMAVANVADYHRSTQLLSSAALRNILGTKNLSDILSDRETIAHMMQTDLDIATDPWGVKVESVEIKDVRLPPQLQRSMAAEAEATRLAKSKVIAAEGEMKASQALRDASEIMTKSPAALTLRYLQTLQLIAAEQNSTIIFPLPMELMKPFMK